MEESDEFSWAVRVVIKRQLRDLLEQLHERGDEVAVMAINTEDGTCSQFGSPYGEWFMSEQRSLTHDFLSYCQDRNKLGKEDRAPYREVSTKLTIRHPDGKITVDRPSRTATVSQTQPSVAETKTDSVAELKSATGTATPPTTRPRRGNRMTPRYHEAMAILKPGRSKAEVPQDDLDMEVSPAEDATDPNWATMNPEADEAISNDDNHIKDEPSIEPSAEEPHQHTHCNSNTNPRIKAVDAKPVMRVRKHYKKTRRSWKERAPVQCDICGNTITGIYNLKVHKRKIHEKVRDSKCSVCSEVFYTNRELDKHVFSVHTRQCANCNEFVVETVPWGNGINKTCPRDVVCACGSIVRMCTNYGRFSKKIRPVKKTTHEKQIHVKPQEDPNFACGKCGKTFTNRISLIRHLFKHKQQSYVCDMCGQQYQTAYNLVNHQDKVHGVRGVHLHKCGICGKNFQNKMTFITHMTRFHPESVGEGSGLDIANVDETTKAFDE